MATYLQNVTDYVPELQPFQPDLNFYSNVLQTKQSQYDSNWKALNKMYGQYFYADLTRDGNIKKKDELLKNMEFNLKRVSQLDLSLEQNVNQATQIFKPFYEDKNLMKDMAWTKTYNSQVGKAQALQGSADAERRKQFWDAGLKELQYKKEEFKNADDATAMSFGNVAYTPYVNSVELAQKIAKDAGLSIETVDFSPDGKWIITQKNGEKLREPLSKLFEARLGSDPSVQAVYRTQAYVNRKDYAYSNAAQFNGDQNAAEMKYLETSFNILKDQNAQRYRAVQDRSKSYDGKIKEIEKSIADKTASPGAEKLLNEYKQAKDINDKILERVEKQNTEFNETSSSTPSTSTGFINPYGDVNSLRWKVDAGMASMLMSKDLNEAAEIFAYKDAKTNIKENPYKVLEVKHAQSMQQIHARGSYSVRAASIKAKGATDAARIRNAGEMEAVKMGELAKKGLVTPKEVPVYDKNGQVKLDPNGKPLTEFVWAKTENEYQVKNVTNNTGEIDIFDYAKKQNEGVGGLFSAVNAQLSEWLKNGGKLGVITEDEAVGMLNDERVLGNKRKDTKGRYIDPTAGMFNKDFTVVDWMQDSGAMTEYKGVKVADPELRRFKAPVVTAENIGKLTKEDIYNIGKAQQHSDRSGLGFVKQDVTKVPFNEANYYKTTIDRIESFIADNYDVPYIESTATQIKEVLYPAKVAAAQNYNFEDWKYKVKEAAIKEDPGAEMLFDENNELLPIEALRQVASKAVYDEYQQGTQSKQGFFESVANTIGFYVKGSELNPETAKYWKSWGELFTGADQAPSTWLGEKYAKYSPYLRGPGSLARPGEDNKDYDYVVLKDKLEETHAKVFANMTSSKWFVDNDLGTIPGVAALGAGGTGITSTISAIQVLPQAAGTKGFTAWHSFAEDFRRIGNFDGTQNAILFGDAAGISGIEKTAIADSDVAVAQTGKGRALIEAMISALNDPNTDYKPFTLEASGMALSDPTKAAMIIRPDAKWLEQFKSTGKDEDNNLLTTDDYNAILQNGISVISNRGNFNNPAMGSTYKTPLENIVDYNGFYEESIPGAGTFRIDKGQGPAGNYRVSTKFEIWDPSTSKFNENIVYDDLLPKDRNLELYRASELQLLQEARLHNKMLYNGNYNLY
jgi:hypothetical protein